jgi:hypothetical protein
VDGGGVAEDRIDDPPRLLDRLLAGEEVVLGAQRRAQQTLVALETVAKLKPAFKKDGTVTAGNASGVNDAAAAVVVMSADRAKELNAPVRARILSYAVCGVEPKTMGIGPVPAVRKALEPAGKTLDDVEVIELNEAFAAQSLARSWARWNARTTSSGWSPSASAAARASRCCSSATNSRRSDERGSG